MVRATVADSMASGVGCARHRLLLRISLVPNSGQQSASQLKGRRDGGIRQKLAAGVNDERCPKKL
jgi:hypothetical protein